MLTRWTAGSLLATAVLGAAFAAGIGVVAAFTPGVPFAAMVAGWVLATAVAAVLVSLHANGIATVARSLRAGAGNGELARLADGSGEIADLAGALIRHLREDEAGQDRIRAETDGLRRVVAELPDPVIVLGPDDRISLANAAAARAFGEALPGRDLKTVLREPNLLSALGVVRQGGDGRDIEIAGIGAAELVYRVRVSPMGDDPGETCLLAFTSLTEARRAEQMRVEFVANVSHELRTPLAILHGFVETLMGPARDDAEARTRFLGIMYSQSTRMTQLVEDLLSLTRIEAREHHLPTDTVSIDRVIERTVADARYVAGQKGMTIEAGIRDGLPDVIGDLDELLQVTQNLVDNAVKYGRSDSVVRIEAMMGDEVEPPARDGDAGMVAIAISDQGEGIAREHIPRLTERFYRVDSARSRKLGGTGLGLAIVKHIIARHRGTLAVTSEVGTGSTFTVFLPAAPEG